jgi:uncharacterized protein (DUF2062 family)
LEQRSRLSLPRRDLFAQGARLFRIKPGFKGVSVTGLAAALAAGLFVNFLDFLFVHFNILWCDTRWSSRFHVFANPLPHSPTL